jgi:hypothetical protein
MKLVMLLVVSPSESYGGIKVVCPFGLLRFPTSFESSFDGAIPTEEVKPFRSSSSFLRN